MVFPKVYSELESLGADSSDYPVQWQQVVGMIPNSTKDISSAETSIRSPSSPGASLIGADSTSTAAFTSKLDAELQKLSLMPREDSDKDSHSQPLTEALTNSPKEEDPISSPKDPFEPRPQPQGAGNSSSDTKPSSFGSPPSDNPRNWVSPSMTLNRPLNLIGRGIQGSSSPTHG